eukprot:jgi/Bigna1/75739/fgenesh1_pg.36_\
MPRRGRRSGCRRGGRKRTKPGQGTLFKKAFGGGGGGGGGGSGGGKKGVATYKANVFKLKKRKPIAINKKKIRWAKNGMKNVNKNVNKGKNMIDKGKRKADKGKKMINKGMKNIGKAMDGAQRGLESAQRGMETVNDGLAQMQEMKDQLTNLGFIKDKNGDEDYEEGGEEVEEGGEEDYIEEEYNEYEGGAEVLEDDGEPVDADDFADAIGMGEGQTATAALVVNEGEEKYAVNRFTMTIGIEVLMIMDMICYVRGFMGLFGGALQKLMKGGADFHVAVCPDKIAFNTKWFARKFTLEGKVDTDLAFEALGSCVGRFGSLLVKSKKGNYYYVPCVGKSATTDLYRSIKETCEEWGMGLTEKKKLATSWKINGAVTGTPAEVDIEVNEDD